MIVVQMITCLQLASEQLSQRSHYDFGMRTAVAVLNIARRLFVESSPSKEAQGVTDASALQRQEEGRRLEVMTLCQALRLANLPKLHPTDQRAFEEILRDVFDEDDLKASETQPLLRPFLVKAAKELCLEPSEGFLEKSLQV